MTKKPCYGKSAARARGAGRSLRQRHSGRVFTLISLAGRRDHRGSIGAGPVPSPRRKKDEELDLKERARRVAAFRNILGTPVFNAS
jgi:hypothetical protein